MQKFTLIINSQHLLTHLRVIRWDPTKGMVTNKGEGGGYKTGRGGGTCSFTPTKRGGGKSFSHSEVGGGGHKKFWVVFMW